jgi:Ca-activated chloride channel family protein
MSDGENNEGISPEEFFNAYKKMKGVDSIRTFTILFGEANQKEMQSIADSTGGRMFDAGQDSLPAIFKEIRGYQ